MGEQERIGEAYPEHVEAWVTGGGEPAPVPLSFYRRYALVMIDADREDNDDRFSYLVGMGDVQYLDGSLEAIMRANRAEKLELSREQVPDYLRFVFAHVGEGKLDIVERPGDMPWTSEALSDGLMADLVARSNARVHPIQVEDAPDKQYTAKLTGVFRDVLVECELRVARDGALTPRGNRPLAENLPTAVAKEGDG